MRLLQLDDEGNLSLVEYIGKNIPPYAILSHTWGADHEEVTFKDLIDGTGASKVGYTKIIFCGTQAMKDGLRYFWVDTCCIDKSNNTELSEALNSMFRWYQESTRCYVYLADVAKPPPNQGNSPQSISWEASFRSSRWFTRGWTLQELIAPATVEFFSGDWSPIGDKSTLQRQVHEITGIPVDALQCRDLSYFTVFERMSWASTRQTKREEDMAYSLMGLFSVYLSPIYGEGTEHALARLQEEIRRRSKASLDQLPHVPQAVYNSYDNRGETTCLRNTRVQVLQEIRDWFQTADGPPIFWLSGLAGMGKTTIARTVAQEADEKGSLGSSFFFVRRTADLDSAKKFIPSIAVQLARTIPAMETPIRESLEKYPDLPQLRLQDQWKHLIHGPVSRLPRGSYPPRLLLVVDALDECEGENDVRELLRLLQEAKDVATFQLRVLITSRPETPIRLGFRQMPSFFHRDLSLLGLSRETADQDIRTYLIHEFAEIKQQFEVFTPHWPSDEDVETLVQESGGLFIYAATVCRFIKSNDQWGAEDLLRMILPKEDVPRRSRNRRRVPRSSPFSDLDKVYNQVLDHSLRQIGGLEDHEDIAKETGEIVSTIAMVFEPLSIDTLASLFDMNQGTIYQRLKHLRSVLVVPDDRSDSIRLLHPSFREFLFDPKRCTNPYFLTDQKSAHKQILEKCLDVLSDELREDICGAQKPGTQVSSMSKATITAAIPLHTEYACIYWGRHLLNTEYELRDDSEIFDFLKEHSLHWLEALSWLDGLSDGLTVLRPLRLRMLPTECPSFIDFVYDLERFTLYSRQAIEQAPLQVYASALVFAPRGSVVRQKFQSVIPRWVHQLSWTEEAWSLTLQTLEGHSGITNDVDFSPDGNLLASCSYDCTVRIWDGHSGRQQQTFVGHSATVRAVRFSPDGDTIASAADDFTVRLWDVRTGTIKKTLWGHTSIVRTVAFSPDSSILVSGGFDNVVRIWDLRTGEERQELVGHGGGVFSVAFSQDGSIIASGSWDATVKLWNARTGREMFTLRGHRTGVRSVAFSPTSNTIASASYDSTVKLWDAITGENLLTLRGHSGGIRAVTFSPDGTRIASASYDNTVKLWDAQSGHEKQTLSGHLDYVNGVTFSPDGTLIASASDDHSIKIWDPRTTPEREALQGHLGSVHAVAISPDGSLIASSSSDYTVKLWDAHNGHEKQTLSGHTGGVRAVVISPDGGYVASASFDATAKIWDAKSGRELQTLLGHHYVVNDLAFSPDGDTIATASTDETVKLWNVQSGEEIATLGGYNAWVTAVAFSPDGTTLAIATASSSIVLLDVETGLEQQSLKGASIVNDMSFSRDGSHLCTEQGFIEISTGRMSSALPSPPAHIHVQTEWIVRDSEPLLWLPLEYRARHAAVRGNKVVFGHASGQVSILEFY